MSTKEISESEKRKQIRIFFAPSPLEPKGCLASLAVILDQEKLDKKLKYEKNRWDLLEKWGITEEDIANTPHVSQIDTWLAEDMKNVITKALDRLGLVREELIKEPMLIYGPLFWSTYGIPDEEIVNVKIDDGTLRFSCYQLVVVCLSAERIATYSASFNFLRNVFVNEKTIEFLYRDIVSVSTEEKSTNYNLPDGKTLRRAQVFRLVVPGDNIEVVINSLEIKELLGGEAILSDHDKSVRVIREMLREKKG